MNFNQAVLTPQRRFSVSPRVDYAINQSSTLVARYSFFKVDQKNLGVLQFSLPERAFDQTSHTHQLQLTETAVLNKTTVNETRFQFIRSRFDQNPHSTALAINNGFRNTLQRSLLGATAHVTLLAHDWIFAGVPDVVEMMEFNELGATYLPPFLEVTAQSDRSSIEALRHTWRPIAGTQFHPEATDPATGQPTPGGLAVVNNFIDFCLGVPQRWW